MTKETIEHKGSENLTPWKPGQSGNPAGKPKGRKNRATLFRQWLDLPYRDPKTNERLFHPEDSEFAGQPITFADMLAKSRIDLGLLGDHHAANQVFDSAYGKVPDVIRSEPQDPDSIKDVFVTDEEAALAYRRALES